ncbi:MAG: M24 family metallopeptidase [Fidelibacterota bacterium]
MTNFHRRVEKLNNIIAEQNLDGIYVTYLTNVRYLTGFTGSAGQTIITPSSAYFLSDTRYDEQSKNQVKNCQIQMINSGYLETIEKLNLFKNGMKIGFEANHMSYKLFCDLEEKFPGVEFIPTSDLIEHLAAVKDTAEIESLKSAVEITDVVFDEILPELRIGAVEKHIAAKISYLFKMHGADGDSYDPIIASGWLGALPHSRPSDKAFEKGDFVVMDFAAMYDGYHADLTRTVLIGEATERHKEIYQIVLDSQLAGIDAAKAGVTGADVDQACRKLIHDRGYGDKFIHSTGHGIGLEIHTYPRLNNLNQKPLQENYVVTIEPGIYIPGWGGVRIEDDCWINANHCTPLNRATKELLVLS